MCQLQEARRLRSTRAGMRAYRSTLQVVSHCSGAPPCSPGEPVRDRRWEKERRRLFRLGVGIGNSQCDHRLHFTFKEKAVAEKKMLNIVQPLPSPQKEEDGITYAPDVGRDGPLWLRRGRSCPTSLNTSSAVQAAVLGGIFQPQFPCL